MSLKCPEPAHLLDIFHKYAIISLEGYLMEVYRYLKNGRL